MIHGKRAIGVRTTEVLLYFFHDKMRSIPYQNEFESATVNESSVFKAFNFYCVSTDSTDPAV